jgi:Transposase domain (DUF772)
MKSPFRPDVVPDATSLNNHKPLTRTLRQRGPIRGAPSLAALVMLTGVRRETSGVGRTRPARDLSSLLRALLLQGFYTIRSERQLMEQLNYNPAVPLVCRAVGG